MIKDEAIYIAGPLCFQERGGKLWDSFVLEAEYYGFAVTLPNKNQLQFEEGNKRSLSDAIFGNCRDSINKSTGIIVNLENYRGFQPDGGSIYELGMAYGHDCRCYAFTRDKRTMGVKYAEGKYVGDGFLDSRGKQLPNMDLPFSPCIVGSCKIVEGGFSDALHLYMVDMEEESKNKTRRGACSDEPKREKTIKSDGRPVIYLAGRFRYDDDAKARYDEMKKICEKYGFRAFAPTDVCEGVPDVESEDRYARVYNLFDRFQQHVRNCDIILADLNDTYGYEPDSDVAFECGMAFQLGKKLFGYMDNIGPMIDRIPCKPRGDKMTDANGMDVENFEAPINLMFGSSYKLLDGSFEEVVKKVADSLK